MVIIQDSDIPGIRIIRIRGDVEKGEMACLLRDAHSGEGLRAVIWDLTLGEAKSLRDGRIESALLVFGAVLDVPYTAYVGDTPEKQRLLKNLCDREDVLELQGQSEVFQRFDDAFDWCRGNVLDPWEVCDPLSD